VQLVLFAVQDIVENIDPARDQAEKKKSQQASLNVGRLEQVQGKYHGGKDKDILHPLLDAQGNQDIFQHGHLFIISIRWEEMQQKDRVIGESGKKRV
jgi:hypothetical protein